MGDSKAESRDCHVFALTPDSVAEADLKRPVLMVQTQDGCTASSQAVPLEGHCYLSVSHKQSCLCQTALQNACAGRRNWRYHNELPDEEAGGSRECSCGGAQRGKDTLEDHSNPAPTADLGFHSFHP